MATFIVTINSYHFIQTKLKDLTSVFGNLAMYHTAVALNLSKYITPPLPMNGKAKLQSEMILQFFSRMTLKTNMPSEYFLRKSVENSLAYPLKQFTTWSIMKQCLL